MSTQIDKITSVCDCPPEVYNPNAEHNVALEYRANTVDIVVKNCEGEQRLTMTDGQFNKLAELMTKDIT